MCSHRWFAAVIIVFVLVGGFIAYQGIIHQPKVVTKTVEKCNKPKTQDEINLEYMDKVQEICYRGNDSVGDFKMELQKDGTYKPVFNCRE